MNLVEWYHGNELIGFGRKPADYKQDAFQGIHARYVLVIFDEACGMHKGLWDAATTLCSNDESRMLAIGNPDDPHGEFASVCRPSSGYKVIHVGYEHTPNFTGEPVDEHVAASLIAPRWVESKRKRWGERSALFASKVKGLFPEDSDNGVIPHSWAAKCRYAQLPVEGKRCAGLDVGGGTDRTVLRERVGPVAGREKTWIESDPMVACGEIARALEEWGIERVVVDVIGIGWGLAGRLKELSRKHNVKSSDTVHNAEVVKFNAAEKSNHPEQFFNKRAELYWHCRELSRLETWDLEQVDDDALHEITEAKYKIMDSRGKVQVEKKTEVAKRLDEGSPDRGDALLMAFWEGDSAEASLPANANILTGIGYDMPIGTGIAGPKKRPNAPNSSQKKSRADEDRILKDIMLGR